MTKTSVTERQVHRRVLEVAVTLFTLWTLCAQEVQCISRSALQRILGDALGRPWNSTVPNNNSKFPLADSHCQIFGNVAKNAVLRTCALSLSDIAEIVSSPAMVDGSDVDNRFELRG